MATSDAHVPGTTHSSGPRSPGTSPVPEAVVRREQAVRAAVEQGLTGAGGPVAGLLDLVGIREGARALRDAFAKVAAPGTPVLHTFAAKAAPLVPLLRMPYEDERIGAEVASPGEPALARTAGVLPAHTVFDSPAKTRAELREAPALGIAVNADSAPGGPRMGRPGVPGAALADPAAHPHRITGRPAGAAGSGGTSRL